MLAHVVENPDGTFSSFKDGQDVSDMTYQDLVDAGLAGSKEDNWSDMEESEGDSFPPSSVPSAGAEDNPDTVYDYGIDPLASVSSQANFTPTAWQVNLASFRSMGEHYLMYAVRRTSGSSSYLQYYLVRGKDIKYDNGIYTYTDCDLYTLYNYSSIVNYETYVSSGSVSGSSSLVYSDLYFDYIGNDPIDNAMPYLMFTLFLIVIVLLVIGGRRRV